MNLHYKSEILRVRTHKTYNVYRDVIAQVTWNITIFDKEYPNKVFKSHLLTTSLDLNNINSALFKSANKMTKTDIANKCINQLGGQNFISTIKQHFYDELSVLRKDVDLIDMDVSKIPD